MREETLLFKDVWKLSFLIEILYDGGGMESFTFSLPPKGIEITIPQRVAETKTFGGVFIDDYGLDIGKIHLSGTTGNEAIKIIHRNEGDIWLNGKDEIFYIRDKIIRYKAGEKWGRGEKPAKINLYNLGSNDNRMKSGTKSAALDAWEVVLKDFKITQSSDTPLFYNYSIDFTAIRLIGESKVNSRKAPFLWKLTDIKFFEKILNALEKFYGWSENVKDAVEDFRSNILGYAHAVEQYLVMANGFITGSFDNYMSLADGTAYDIVDLYNTFKRISMAPADAALKMVESAGRIRAGIDAVIAMVEDSKTLPEQWSDRYGSVGKAIDSEIQAYKNYFEDNMQELENAVNDEYAKSASGANPEIIVVPNDGTSPGPGGDNEESSDSSITDRSITSMISYGYLRHIATSETTLEKLADFYLKDPDKAQMLAIINGITGDDEINPGDQIKIPILSETSLNTLNHIFGSVNNRDALGIDIAIDNGVIVIGPNGDIVEKTDYENMNQAIGLRLSESIGNRIRLNTYGIRNVAGIPDSVAMAYITVSIKDTVMQDPRVERVENLYFKGIGDAIFVSFDYYTYDGVVRRYEGGL